MGNIAFIIFIIFIYSYINFINFACKDSIVCLVLFSVLNCYLITRVMHNLKLKKNKDNSITLKQSFVFDHIMEGCQIIGYDWKYIYLNDAADMHNRRPKEELLGKSYMEIWPGVEETEVYKVIKESLEQRKYNQLENEFIFPDGSSAWFDLRIQPVPEGVFILSIDITDRKKAIQNLVESEQLFGNLFENMLNGFAYCKMIYEEGKPPDFLYINVNKAFVTHTGLKDVEGKKASEVILGIQAADPGLFERYGRVALTGKPEVFEIWVEALKMWFLISVYCPKKGYFVAVFDVITDRKSFEAALLSSEERFRSLYENVAIGIYRTSVDGRIIMANPAMVNMLGFDSFEQLAQRNLEKEGYEPGYPRSEFLETMKKEGMITGLESVWNKRDGNLVFVRESARAIRNADGRCLYYDGTVEDITERVKIEEALRESEDKFKYIFEHSVMGNSISLPTGEVHFNKAFCEMLGYSGEELKLLKWQDFTHPDDFDITENIIKSLTSRDSDSPRFIKRYIRKNGSVLWADVSTSLRYDNSGKALYFMTTINDITNIKLAEETLRESEERFRSMANSIPQLAWVAHADGFIYWYNQRWYEYTGYDTRTNGRLGMADCA